MCTARFARGSRLVMTLICGTVPQPDPLNLLEPRLVEYHATVIIPFDEGVVFIGLLNCAKVAGRLSEVAQPPTPISGIELLASGGGRGERWPFGTIGVGGCAGVRQRRLRGLRKFDYPFVGNMSHNNIRPDWSARSGP